MCAFCNAGIRLNGAMRVRLVEREEAPSTIAGDDMNEPILNGRL